jgi:dihydrofolate reductase
MRRKPSMRKVTADISMSLDGFVTDPDASVGTRLEGHDPGRLHDWMFDARTDADARIRDELYAATGAVVIGKTMFDVGFEPWGDPPPFGMPVFVVTHEPRTPLPMLGGTTYTFVPGGIHAALDLARVAAGDRDVGIWGGANILRQYLASGVLDELHLHIVPILLGGGVPLFEQLDPSGMELTKLGTVETPRATHVRFAVRASP